MNHRFKVLLFYGVTAVTAFFILYSVFSQSDSGERYNREAEDAPTVLPNPLRRSILTPPQVVKQRVAKYRIANSQKLTIEIRRLRDSVNALNNSVKTLTRKMVPSFDNTFLVDTAGVEAKYRHNSCRHLNTSKVSVLSADTKQQYALSSVCTP